MEIAHAARPHHCLTSLRLTENDFLIWSYITTHKKHCLAMSINRLQPSEASFLDRSIMRFCQCIGFDGFSEFK
ncbi:MAG: hypothetical protein ACLSIL_13020 [Enterococcus casseliflavus]